MAQEISWPTKRLLMAEIDNEEDGGDETTLGTALDSLQGGYEPYDGFEKGAVESELKNLIRLYGDEKEAEDLITNDDWKKRAADHQPSLTRRYDSSEHKIK